MAKGVLLGLLGGLAVAALLPAAAAHGAPAPNVLYTRVLLDDGDGGQDYGGCPDAVDAGSCPGDQGALDLLALDVREAASANGTAWIIWRTIFQARDATHDGRAVEIAFQSGGRPRLMSFGGNGANFTSATCDRLVGPFDAPGSDGTPKSVDCYAREDALGIAAGAQVTDLTVTSFVGGEKGDYMPGGWYLGGQALVPAATVPDDPTNPEPPNTATMEDPGGYTATGPARLLTGSASMAPGTTMPTATIAIRIAGTVNETQLATLRIEEGPTTAMHGAEGTAYLDDSNASLPGPGIQRSFLAHAPLQPTPSTITFIATTDLGGFLRLAVTLPALPSLTSCPSHGTVATGASPTSTAPSTPSASTSPGGQSSTSCTPPSSTPAPKSSPATPALSVGLGLIAAAMWRRRPA